MLHTNISNNQPDLNGAVPSWIRMKTYITACQLYAEFAVPKLVSFLVIQPYFQSLYETDWPLLADEDTMPIIQVAKVHVITAFRQARSELMKGERYKTGQWAARLDIKNFDTLVHDWQRKNLFSMVEAEGLCIEEIHNSVVSSDKDELPSNHKPDYGSRRFKHRKNLTNRVHTRSS